MPTDEDRRLKYSDIEFEDNDDVDSHFGEEGLGLNESTLIWLSIIVLFILYGLLSFCYSVGC